MDRFLSSLALFVIVFTIVVVLYNLLIYKRQLKKREYMEIIELKYLYTKFKLDVKKISYIKILKITSILNGFIIASTSVITIILELSYMWLIIIGFAMLMAEIYVLYEILGRILIKKGYEKK